MNQPDDYTGTGPDELWLQLHGDCAPDELTEPVDYTSGDVTWCWHQIHDSDVRYVRADLANAGTGPAAEVAASAAERGEARAVFEAWYAPKFASGSVANMPIRENGEYRSAQQQIAWMAFRAGLQRAAPTYSELLAQRDELAAAARFAADVLSEIYAKHSLKIGPFSSQAQKANVMLGAALSRIKGA